MILNTAVGIFISTARISSNGCTRMHTRGRVVLIIKGARESTLSVRKSHANKSENQKEKSQLNTHLSITPPTVDCRSLSSTHHTPHSIAPKSDPKSTHHTRRAAGWRTKQEDHEERRAKWPSSAVHVRLNLPPHPQQTCPKGTTKKFRSSKKRRQTTRKSLRKSQDHRRHPNHHQCRRLDRRPLVRPRHYRHRHLPATA
jgi:hypothetical protein